MVVTAGDSYPGDAGFPDDASDGMPGIDTGAMPMDGDNAALSNDVLADGEATPEAQPFSIESLPLTPEQLEAFREHVSAELTPQLDAQIAERESLWEQQRQSLEAKVNAFDRDRRQAANVLAARQRVYQKFFEESGVDARDLKALEHDVSQEARRMGQYQAQQQAQTQQVQQAQTQGAAHFDSEVNRVRGIMHEYAKSVGLDPANPEINADFDTAVVNAARLVDQFPGNRAAEEALEAAKALHKKRVTDLGKLVQRRAAAKPSSEALDRQRGRGVQNLGRGSGGGNAPPSFKALIAQIQQQQPALDYTEVHMLANTAFQSQRQQR